MSKRRPRRHEGVTSGRRSPQIFRDLTARRRQIVKSAAYVLLVVAILLVGGVALRVWVAPSLPELGLGDEATSSRENEPSLQLDLPKPVVRPGPADVVTLGNSDAMTAVEETPWDANPPAVYVVVPPWSAAAFESLKVNLSAIDVMLPQWYQIASASGEIEEEAARRQASLAGYIADNKPSMAVLPIVGASTHPDAAAKALSSVDGRQNLVDALARAASAGGYQGFCLDIWAMPGVSDEDILLLMAELKRALAAADRQTCLIVPLADEGLPLEALSSVVDRIVLLGFEEPEASGRPGPIAPQDWFAGKIGEALARFDPKKTVVALGSGGFDWISGRVGPEEIDFPTAMHLAKRHEAEVRTRSQRAELDCHPCRRRRQPSSDLVP